MISPDSSGSKTPVKRKMTTSPFGSPTTKKDSISGYILDVGAISTGDAPFYQLQVQIGEFLVTKMRAYNTKVHKTLLGFQKSEEKVRLDVRRYENNNLSFGSYCQAYKAAASDVTFPLNTALRTQIQAGKISRDITIKELRAIDPAQNRETFNLVVKVNLGPAELEDLTTTNGATKIKRDIIIQDPTGEFGMQCFESRLKHFADGKCYQIKHGLLKKMQGDTFIGLNADTVITAAPDIEDLSTVSTFTNVNKVKVKGFDSIKDITLHYNCPSCKKPIEDIGTKAVWVRCVNSQCSSKNRAESLSLHASCLVKFADGENEVWAHIFHQVLDRHLAPITSVEQVDSFLETIVNFTVLYKDNVIKDIILSDEESSSEGKENNEENQADERVGTKSDKEEDGY